MLNRFNPRCASSIATTAQVENYSKWNNTQLMKVIAGQRDVRAFSELYRRFAPRAFTLAHSITRRPEDAADAIQESMLRLWIHASTCRPEQIGPWLRKIVTRESIKKLNRNSIKFSSENKSTEKEMKNTSHRIPEMLVENSELEACLQSLMSQLPKCDRKMLALYFWDGCSQNTIAETLAMPQRTVSLRLKEIIHRLRCSLADIGWGTRAPNVNKV